MLSFALLLQAAVPATVSPPVPVPPVTRASAAPPERFSILLPACPAAQGRDVVVCGGDAAAQRLPLPDEIVPEHGVASNPYRTGSGALAAEGTPCAALQGGCQVGFGPPIVPMIIAGVRGVGNALKDAREARARRRDGDRRVPIDLSDTPTRHIEP